MDRNCECDKAISWTAYEEARQIKNPEFFSELYKIIDAGESNEIKNNAYFILGHNAKNCNDLPATEYLLTKLAIEKTKRY